MKVKVKASITITINEKEYSMTMEDAKQLHTKLGEILPTPPQLPYVPNPYPYPRPITEPPYTTHTRPIT